MPLTNETLTRAFYADCNNAHDQDFTSYAEHRSVRVGLCSSFWEMASHGLHPALLATLLVSGTKWRPKSPEGLIKEFKKKKSHNHAHGGCKKLCQATETESEKILIGIYQQIWKTKQWYTDWECSVYTPIFKKGDAKEGINWRTTLIAHVSEAMLKVIQQRLLPYTEQDKQDVPTGFRKGRDTRDGTVSILWTLQCSKGFWVSLCFTDDSNALTASVVKTCGLL